jgi:hypothetical protein
MLVVTLSVYEVNSIHTLIVKTVTSLVAEMAVELDAGGGGEPKIVACEVVEVRNLNCVKLYPTAD